MRHFTEIPFQTVVFVLMFMSARIHRSCIHFSSSHTSFHKPIYKTPVKKVKTIRIQILSERVFSYLR